MPSLNYDSRNEMKIFVENAFKVCYFEVKNFAKKGISLNEQCEWGLCFLMAQYQEELQKFQENCTSEANRPKDWSVYPMI